MTTSVSIEDRLEEFEGKLRDKLAELEEIQAQSAGSRQAVELDQSRVGRLSRMDALQGQQMAAETARRREIDLSRIKAALQRVESGDYGYCLECDEPIPLRRLEYDPATPVCVECARKGS